MQSLLFDIKKYAINDGPGIRVTLFFKGCPLSCLWCHNPESLSPKRQKMYSASRCIGDFNCIDVCPEQALSVTPDGVKTDKELCCVCGKCADICSAKAIEMSGKVYKSNELIRIIERETIFFDQSEGGVTFSGGEPLLQHESLIDLLKHCREKDIHTVVDTTLLAKSDVVKTVAEHTNLFLVDLKSLDEATHKKYTGVSNRLILENITSLADIGADFIIRIPFINGVNASEENIIATAEFLNKLNWKRREVELLPYHDIAKGKHTRLDTEYKMPGNAEPTQEQINRAIEIFREFNISAKV